MVKEFFIECHQLSTKANLEAPKFRLEGKVCFGKIITKSSRPNHLNTYPTRHEYFLETLTSCHWILMSLVFFWGNTLVLQA